MSALRRIAPWALFLLLLEGLGQLAFSQTSVVDSLAGSRTGRKMASLQRASVAHEGGHGTLHAVAAGTLTEDPDLGWRVRPGRFEDSRSVQTVAANGRRLSAPADWSPTPDRPTLALLGDSFTFGDEVSDDETWAWQLRERSGTTVHNLGVLGYGLDQMLLRWESAPESADVVLVGLTAISEYRTGLDWDAWAKPWFEQGTDGLVLRGHPVPASDELLARQWSLATPWLLALWQERLFATPMDWNTLAPLNDALRTRLARAIEASGATPVFVWMAAQGELDGRPADSNRLWQRWCGTADVLCVDTTPTLHALSTSGTRVIRTAHWTPEANAAVAVLIEERLQAAALLP